MSADPPAAAAVEPPRSTRLNSLERVSYPHMHLGSSQLNANAVVGSHDHIPTGRIPFDSVLSYLIKHQGVVAQRSDYAKTLASNNQQFTR